MLDYTLSKLPSAEFEQLCRDLLQKRDEVFIESFKDKRWWY
jgi:molybdopterin-guanine dinucleotide biosynthesis protein